MMDTLCYMHPLMILWLKNIHFLGMAWIKIPGTVPTTMPIEHFYIQKSNQLGNTKLYEKKQQTIES